MRTPRSKAPPQTAPVADPADPLWARSVRFALTITPAIVFGLAASNRLWLIDALVTATVAFSVDAGGTPRRRLEAMAAGVVVLTIGMGTARYLAPFPIALMLAFAISGVIYALTESAHLIAMTLSRFLCFALAIGAIYPDFGRSDFAVVAGSGAASWLISVLWDAGRGAWRRDNGPHWRQVAKLLHANATERRVFALVVGIVIPLTYWACLRLGLERPYWALLTLVLVLRADFLVSRVQMTERFIGTILGVTVAGVYAGFLPEHGWLMAGIVVAALLRWPAQQQGNALGIAALTTYVMLMIEMIAATRSEALDLLRARVLDTGVGCVFALAAIALDRALDWTARRMARR